jgi:cell wall-associated NlpC family hydrolase
LNTKTYKRWLVAYMKKRDIPIPSGFRITNNCGKACQTAIKRVQARARIKRTSRFDDRTIWLIAPLHQRVAIVAEKEKGAKEWPAGSNSGPEVNRYLKATGLGPGYPWCAAFVTWCLKKAGYKGSLPQNTAYVPSWVNWAKAKGKTVKPRHARRGDLICFEFDNDHLADHIGIVLRNRWWKQEYLTIEGNTSVTSDDNGGKVQRRTRYFSQVATIIRYS